MHTDSLNVNLASGSKANEEMRYWSSVKQKESTLHNSWYEYFYTTHFGLDISFYANKAILDIGCGPRGSLEWADVTSLRIGLDPLADSYRLLGTDQQKMAYVQGHAEAIPFPDGHFDVVCSFNSLDHVDHLGASLREIERVIAPGGLFLLLTDVNHRPTICEPLTLSWGLTETISHLMELVEERHYEKNLGGMYQSLKAGELYDHSNPAVRYGILSAVFRKGRNQ